MEKTKRNLLAAVYREKNREKIRARQRAYYYAHRDERQAAQRGYYENHRGERKVYNRAHHVAHRAEVQAYNRLRHNSNPQVRLAKNLRNRLGLAVKGTKKSAPTCELLGCKIPELRAHLESRFRPGMTWENYGPVWHIDHIRACAKFDLLDPAQQRECFHYTNLQPLFAEENLKKGAR